jgi:hypothetical protein
MRLHLVGLAEPFLKVFSIIPASRPVDNPPFGGWRETDAKGERNGGLDEQSRE